MEMDFFSESGPQVAGEVTIGEEPLKVVNNPQADISRVISSVAATQLQQQRRFAPSKHVLGVPRAPIKLEPGAALAKAKLMAAAPRLAAPTTVRPLANQTLKIITPSGEQRVITVRTAATGGVRASHTGPYARVAAVAQQGAQHIQLVQQPVAAAGATVQNLVIRHQPPQQVVVPTAAGGHTTGGSMVVLPPGMSLPRHAAPRGRAPATQRHLVLQAAATASGSDTNAALMASRQFARRNTTAGDGSSAAAGGALSYEAAVAGGLFPMHQVAGAGQSPPSTDDEGDGGPGDGYGRGRGQGGGANGLRKYSRNVLEKVRGKGATSYNEVADELVQEYAAEHPTLAQDQLLYHQKNIRRRVYDALNVLMAMAIISKDKKEIRWVGLPLNYVAECRTLEAEREERLERIAARVQEVQEQMLHLIAVKNLIARNKMNERLYGGPPAANQIIELPYLIVLSNKRAAIECSIANDKMEYLFNFDRAFEIRDDIETLKRLGLCLNLDNGTATEEEFSQCYEQVPLSMRFYVEAMYERRPPIVPDFTGVHAQRKLVLEQRLAVAAAGGQPSRVATLSDDSDDLDVG